MASGLELIQLGSQIKAHFSRADQYADKAEQHYKAAGMHLMEAQQRIKAGEYGKPFSHYCMTVIGVSPSRCYEYIQIANGTKSLEQIREEQKGRKQKERSNVRDVTESSQPTETKEVSPKTTQRPPHRKTSY